MYAKSEMADQSKASSGRGAADDATAAKAGAAAEERIATRAAEMQRVLGPAGMPPMWTASSRCGPACLLRGSSL